MKTRQRKSENKVSKGIYFTILYVYQRPAKIYVWFFACIIRVYCVNKKRLRAGKKITKGEMKEFKNYNVYVDTMPDVISSFINIKSCLLELFPVATYIYMLFSLNCFFH